MVALPAFQNLIVARGVPPIKSPVAVRGHIPRKSHPADPQAHLVERILRDRLCASARLLLRAGEALLANVADDLVLLAP
eukprot:4412283-Pyramimonas_sp.AAC.1